MNDDLKEWQKSVEKRLSLLEQGQGLNGETFEAALILPQADIDGLRFNKQEVRAVFEKKKGGWWQSRDILFLSARNTEDDNSRDILTEYLNLPGDNGIREQLAGYLDAYPQDIEVFLPEETQGIKKYNGVDWLYWLRPRSSFSAAHFRIVYAGGYAYYGSNASGVGGCAPAFRIV